MQRPFPGARFSLFKTLKVLQILSRVRFFFCEAIKTNTTLFLVIPQSDSVKLDPCLTCLGQELSAARICWESLQICARTMHRQQLVNQAGKLGSSYIFFMQLLTKVCLVGPRRNSICLCNCIPTAELWHKSFFFSVYGLESWQQTKVLRWGYVASDKELGNRLGEEEGIIKDTLRLFHAGASEMLLAKLKPSHGWAGRPPEFRNRPWISQKDPGLSQKN